MEAYVVFDLVGTCFSYDVGIACVEERFGERFKKENIKTRLFFYAMMSAAERDYSYLSQTNQYKTFTTVIRHSFYRNLHFAGIAEPEEFCRPDDVDALIAAWQVFEPRPGLHEMVDKLRAAGIKVCAATDASADRVKGYFDNCGIDFPLRDILSGDEVGAGKPEFKFYKAAMAKHAQGMTNPKAYFAASHSWDTSAAKQAGFRTAFCTNYERYPVIELFGQPDLIADDLVELADKIIADVKK